MKYGLTRRLNVYGIENGVGEEVIATAGDYMQAQLWCSKHLKDVPEGIADLYGTFAWGWFALRRTGKLAGYGLAEELTRETLDDMTNTVTVYMETIPDDSLPLEGSATQPKK